MGRPPMSEEEKARREAEKGEKRPVGRPRLTAEQLAEREAQKEQLAIQNEMEQNASIIQHSLAGLSAAPVNLLDAEEVVRRSLEYFADCTRSGAKVTPPGLALWLGITSADLTDWLTGIGTEDHRRSAARIYQLLHSAFMDTALNGKQSPQLSMFLAKNWFGYTDAQRIETAQVVEKRKSLDELAKEAEALPDGDVVDVDFKEVKKGKKK